MDIVLAVLAILGFVAGITALSLSVLSAYKNHAQIVTQLAEAKAELQGIENRLERYTDKRLAETAIEVRALAQQDAFDYINSQSPQGGPQDYGIGNFRNFGG